MRKKNFNFHSDLLGDLKLDVRNIRSIEFASSNSTRLTLGNGDSLTVSLLDPALKLKTSFGKVELPADSIRKLSVTLLGSAIPHHAGLVALWSGEGNAKDSAGNHDGELLGDCGFGAGQFGGAFDFSSPDSSVKIPAATDLDVGTGSGFTLEAWINPTDVASTHPIFEWNNAAYWGVHFHIAPGQAFNTSSGPGELYANIPDSHGMWHQLSSPGGVVSPNVFQHVALSYDKLSGVATIYCNGQVVGRQNIGKFTPLTSYDLYLGHREAPEGERTSFAGLLDEAAVYNRALTDKEIHDDYAAGNIN